jgi:hypothetical protein
VAVNTDTFREAKEEDVADDEVQRICQSSDKCRPLSGF